ncbi:MAG: YihY family inner membrane protein [Gammaproteobacteria bacterium]|nr:YihY family inner membrane protein [Gammaproteobacteria bacterium]
MIAAWIHSAKTALGDAVWATHPVSASPFKRLLCAAARVLITVVRDLADGQISLRAMSLVYTTLLSLVPLLAVSFSVLKAFGVHNQLEGLLLNVLSALGEEGIRVTDQIVGFVDKMDVRVLGSTGSVVLIYTVVATVQKIDAAVNHTWRIHRTRSFLDRFSRYLSLILIGPVLVVSAISISASLMSNAVVQSIIAIEPFGAAYRLAVGLVPYCLITAAFTFVYLYIPNTRVRVSAAMTGGLVAGLIWAGGSGLAAFAVGWTGKYTAIYSSFAALIVFMMWLYACWLIVLIGASVAFYTQHPEYLSVQRVQSQMGNRLWERAGLQVMRLIAGHFLRAQEPWVLPDLASYLNLPLEHLRGVVERLEAHGLLRKVSAEMESFVPAKDLQVITVGEILKALRAAERDAHLLAAQMRHDGPVESIMTRLDDAIGRLCDEQSLREFVLMEVEPAAPTGPVVVAGGKSEVASNA